MSARAKARKAARKAVARRAHVIKEIKKRGKEWANERISSKR
jgi:hypothetical protein